MALTDETIRVGHLYQVFDQHFGRTGSTRLVRAPGRVNLIGDHIDYNYLPVMPMAIQHSTLLVLRPRDDDVVRLVNTDARFPPRSFRIEPAIEPGPRGDWSNYARAAVQTLLEVERNLRGFDAAVSGSIPIASGLSSSSSLVVAVALGVAAQHDLHIPPAEMMDRLAAGERYVGTEGGGMDQAVVLGGVEGSAVRIDFDPMRLTPVSIPDTWKFIVASSLVEAQKSGAAQEVYNRRVQECQNALHIVADHLDHELVDGYRGLLDAHSSADLIAAAPLALDKLHTKRFRHVVTEAGRVERAVELLRDHDLTGFGNLMNESHASLRDDYGVSIPELDELTDLAVDSGAAGARLTGAGMGGCIVALCHETYAATVVTELQRHYYAFREFEDDLTRHLFVASPSAGAAVLDA